MPVSLRDVAAKAGVSIGTVSSVVNDKAAARISSETQRRVRMVAEEMGYFPNHFARSLVQQKTDTIGVLVPLLSNAFYLSLVEAAETRILNAGYRMLIDNPPFLWDGSHNKDIKIRSWPVDGALVWALPTQTIKQYLGAQSNTLPVVYLGHERTDNADTVAVDHYGGGKLAAEHLISRGYRKLAHVSPYQESLTRNSEPRFQGFADVCREAGVPLQFISTSLLTGTRADGLETGLAIAALSGATRPDALFCHNDILAIGVHRGLRRAGLHVPDDVAIIGFDGIEEGRFLEKPLTSVEFPVDRLCKSAMNILKLRIEGETQRQQLMIPSTLIAGGTT